MANQRTYPVASADIGRVPASILWTSGASSAAPTSYTRGRVFRGMSDSPAGIVKTTTGTVTLNLKEQWIALISYNVQIKQATYNASTGACKARLSVNSVSAAVPLLTFVFQNEAGATVELAAGDIVTVDLVLQKTASV